MPKKHISSVEFLHFQANCSGAVAKRDVFRNEQAHHGGVLGFSESFWCIEVGCMCVFSFTTSKISFVTCQVTKFVFFSVQDFEYLRAKFRAILRGSLLITFLFFFFRFFSSNIQVTFIEIPFKSLNNRKALSINKE